MRISQNPTAMMAHKGITQSSQALFSAMERLSSGKRINRPGDAPADFGISEHLRYQIRNGEEARRNLEKARTLINTTDTWMQTVQDILGRMSQLATAAVDASKSQDDRDNLNVEFQQLRDEIKRISHDSRYNGIQIAGQDQILTYDEDLKKFVFSQLDGSEYYELNVKTQSGLSSDNGLDFLFDSSKDYTLSADGRYIFYVDSNNNLNRYEVESGNLSRDTADSEDKGLDVDEQGRLWYAAETATGSGVWSLRQEDVDGWTQDTSIVGNADIVDMGSTEFSVYDDRIYYLNSSGDVVSRSLSNPAAVSMEASSTDITLTTTAGRFAISEDGQFVADIPVAGSLRVTHMATMQSQTISIGAGLTVAGLSFSVDNNQLSFVDTTEGSIYNVDLLASEMPELSNLHRVRISTNNAGYSGLSLDGGSNQSRFRVHSGPDGIHQSFVSTADLRLTTLGLSREKLTSQQSAIDALERVTAAINKVSIQRSIIGAQQSRLDHSYQSLARYTDNIAAADSVIRDADIAEETANMSQAQIQRDAAISLLAQANQRASSILGLLNR